MTTARLKALLTARSAKSVSRLLGDPSGVWTPTRQVGITAPTWRPGTGAPVLIITQEPAITEHLLVASARRGLPVGAAIAAPGDLWLDLAMEAATLDPPPCLLLLLHRPCRLAALAHLARSRARAVLLLTTSAGPVPDLPALPAGVRLDARSLATALGLTVVTHLEALVDAAALLGAGLSPRTGRLLALAESAVQADLLDEALRTADLTHALRTITPTEQRDLSRGRRGALALHPAGRVLIASPAKRPSPLLRRLWTRSPFDALLCGDIPAALRLHPTPTAAALSTARTAGAVALGFAALHPIAALLRSPRSPDDPPLRRPPRTNAPRARRLLDGWRALFGDKQAKQLLGCYDLGHPPERLVTSASAAGQAARALGLPVAIKAVGPTLGSQRVPNVLIAPVASVAAARQAFREVLDRCARPAPPPFVDGVMVSRFLPRAATLSCTLCWPDDAPPILTLQRLDLPPPREQSAACPLPATAAEGMARLLLERREGRSDLTRRRRLGALLARLSWLGADLAGRMVWLHLELALPRPAGAPPLLVDASGCQRESLRAPFPASNFD